MGYHLKIKELMDIEEAMLTQLGAWMEQLDAVSRALAPLSMTTAVDGAAGDSIRSFLSEVHQPVAAGLQQAMSDMQVHLLQYADGFYQIEQSHEGDIRQDVLEGTQEGLQKRQGELEDIAAAVKDVLQSIGDIVTIGIPSDGSTKDSFEASVQSLATLNDKIGSHDAAHEQDTAAMKDILNTVSALMNQYGAGGESAEAYEPGSILSNPMYQHLGEGLQASAAYVKQNLSACEEAIERYGKRWNDRLAEERIEEGFWNALAGVAAVVAGALLIVATAGMAAPIVVGAAVVGVTSGLYGLSNTAEGLQDICLGFQGDGSSVAFNPIRDTIFKGNPEMYYTIGNTAMIVSAFCAPVIGAGGAAATAGSSVGRAMLVEGGKVGITGLAAGASADYVYDRTGSRGLSFLTGLGVGIATYGGLSRLDRAANISGLHTKPTVKDLTKRTKELQEKVKGVDGKGAGGADDIYANKGITSGDDWNNYLKDKYGSSNVRWDTAVNSMDDILDTPSITTRLKPEQLADFAQNSGWKVEPLGKGSKAGLTYEQGGGFSMRAPNGASEYIQYHPGGGHHGELPYYKISSGKNGTVRYFIAE